MISTSPRSPGGQAASDSSPPGPAAPEPAAPASGAGRPQVVAAGIACSRTPLPVPPAVSSEVKGSLFAIGTLKAGRVVQVDIDRNTLKGIPDRRLLATEEMLKEMSLLPTFPIF